MLEADDIDAKSLEQWRDDNACNQVAQNRAQTETGGNWNCDDASNQKYEGENQKAFHVLGSFNNWQRLIRQNIP